MARGLRFRPFTALRYDDPEQEGAGSDAGVLDLTPVIAPRSVLTDAADRQRHCALSRFNVTHLLETDAPWAAWLQEGLLCIDEIPAFYAVRIGGQGPDGERRQSEGVFGLIVPAGGDDAPNRASADFLPFAIDAPGISDLFGGGLPLARGTSRDGTHHRMWALTQPGTLRTIGEAVEKGLTHNQLAVNQATLAFVYERDSSVLLEPALGLVFLPPSPIHHTEP